MQKPQERIVFIGDSITDGNTYPSLICQALIEAGRTPPVAVNAGIGGDTSAGMKSRLDRDVFVHHPTLATLSSGVNDANRKVAPEDYEANIVAIIERMKQEKVPLIIMTLTPVSAQHSEAQLLITKFNEILRSVAQRYGLRVAEINAAMNRAQDAGETVLAPDGIHIVFAGYRVMTRVLLDSLGYEDVPVPQELVTNVMPGLIREWRMRPAPGGAALDDAASKTLTPGDGWNQVTLPQTEPQAEWWPDSMRRIGVALDIDKPLGAGKRYQGVSYLESKNARPVYFNPGAGLETIWLNGSRIYRNDDTHGWHPGRERIPVTLAAGRNTIVIECSTSFFLNVTDDNLW